MNKYGISMQPSPIFWEEKHNNTIYGLENST